MWIETRRRSVLKSISYRILGTIITASTAFILTKNFNVAAAIGGIEIVSKTLLYLFHERAWDKVRYGKKQINPFVLWLTGLPSSGKSTLAKNISNHLRKKGLKVEHLDGDVVRDIFPQTGFTKEERDLHIKRIGYLSSMLEKNGVIVIASFVSPYKEARQFVRNLCNNFHEIFIDAPVHVCEKRDIKGLYKKAREGLIKNFTGINDPYEMPENPELIIKTENKTVDEASKEIIDYINKIMGNLDNRGVK